MRLFCLLLSISLLVGCASNRSLVDAGTGLVRPEHVGGDWAISPGVVAVPRIELRALTLVKHIYDDTCMPSEIGQVSEGKFPLAYREVMHLGRVSHPTQGELDLVFVLRTIYTMLSPRGLKDFLIIDSEGEVVSRNGNIVAGADLIILRAGRYLSIGHEAGLELDLWHTRGLSAVSSWMTTTHELFEAIWEMIELQNSLVTDQASNKNQQGTWAELISATIEVTHCNEFLFDRYIVDKLSWQIDSEDDFEVLAYVRLAGALGVDQHSITKAAEHFNMNELVERAYKEGVKAQHG